MCSCIQYLPVCRHVLMSFKFDWESVFETSVGKISLRWPIGHQVWRTFFQYHSQTLSLFMPLLRGLEGWQYKFIIQGMAVVFQVQKEYRKVARRTSWLPDCIRVKYGGYTGYSQSTTPNQSTSSGGNNVSIPGPKPLSSHAISDRWWENKASYSLDTPHPVAVWLNLLSLRDQMRQMISVMALCCQELLISVYFCGRDNAGDL